MIGYKSVEVSGVKSAIKELRKIDPELRKQFNKDAKEVVRPVIEAAKANYPANVPVWHVARLDTRRQT
jgi:mRNA-degrading endonuclease RelE of RelBE toxin-antitoxin system